MKKKYSAIFITVRSSSSRLPKKCYLEIDGRKTIEYVIERAKRTKLYDKIILCTTRQKGDKELSQIAKKHGINCYRGSLNDKLDRWLKAAKKFNVEFFATADGDDLFVSPQLLDAAHNQYTEGGCNMIKAPEDFFCGCFTFLIDVNSLEKVCANKKTKNTEMMWVLFEKEKDIKIVELNRIGLSSYVRPEIRATLDYQEDFDFFKKVVEKFNSYSIDVVSFDNVSLMIGEEESKINFHRHQDWKNNQMKKIEEMGKDEQ